MRYAWLLVLAMGCGPVIDNEPPDSAADLPGEIAAPPGAAQATALIVSFYESQTSVTLPIVGVRWTTDQIALADWPDGVIGACFTCRDIRVRWTEATGERFDLVALAHEIGHCAHGFINGSKIGNDDDGSHSDLLWWGESGFVAKANLELFNQGL